MTSYTLFGQASFTDISGAGTSATTCGVVFTLSQQVTLGKFWWWSRPAASELPNACAVWDNTGTLVGSTSLTPSWSGAIGSGWVSASYGSPPTLAAGTYTAGCYLPAAGSPSYGEQSGNPSISNGPLSASGTWGRIIHTTGIALPTTSIAIDFGVDIEVTPTSGSHTASASLTVTPSFSAPRTRSTFRTGALTVSPSLSASRARGKYRTGTLPLVPAFSVHRTQAHVRHGSLLVPVSFLGVPSGGAVRQAKQGSWWQLDSVLKLRAEYASYYRSQTPVACPNDGTPLLEGPPQAAAVLYCPMGDWQYPRDYDPIVHSGM